MKKTLVISVGLPGDPEGSDQRGVHGKHCDNDVEGINHDLEICDEWELVEVFQLKDWEPVITIHGNNIYWGAFKFDKDFSLKLKDGSIITWDGNRSAENILKHREKLIAWKNEKLRE